MGRKKSDPIGLPPRPTAATIKGTPEWRAWVDEAATHCRETIASFFDKAAVEYAKDKGFTKPPPPR